MAETTTPYESFFCSGRGRHDRQYLAVVSELKSTASQTLAVAVLLVGCCSPKANDVLVGDVVEATSNGMTKAGHVTERYGKLAHVDFDDGDHAWFFVEELDPSGIAEEAPPDPCAFAAGERVLSPWYPTGKAYAGRVTEVHGKFAAVLFDDGDRTWTPCAELKAHKNVGER